MRCRVTPPAGLIVALLTLGVVPGGPSNSVAKEPVPAPQRVARPPLIDAPVSSITADIYPRDAKGSYATPDGLPENAWAMSGREGYPLFIDGSQMCSLPGCEEVLQLARFCHHPLYFEDALLERYGVVSACPPVHAAARFALDCVLLPVRLVATPPRDCVRTPTPSCARLGCCP
ncbi:MAG: hypothetical protein ACRCT8_03855 [Lacipirellulaceae bacterium]